MHDCPMCRSIVENLRDYSIDSQINAVICCYVNWFPQYWYINNDGIPEFHSFDVHFSNILNDIFPKMNINSEIHFERSTIRRHTVLRIMPNDIELSLIIKCSDMSRKQTFVERIMLEMI